MEETIKKATHAGVLKIGDIEIPCYVLEDGTRVISQRGLQKSIGMSEGGGTMGAQRIARFVGGLEEKGLKVEGLSERTKNPIIFSPPHGGNPAYGYEATVLSDLCEFILQCRDKNLLAHSQMGYADACEIIIRAFARIGIIALVDEATGYQYTRARNALHEILEQFIAKELQPWVKTFGDDFYIQIFRLNNWPYTETSIRKRPGVIGKWTNDIIYDRLAPGVRNELHNLAERDERGRPKHRLFQRLTQDIGHPKLREHLAAVTALMMASNTWKEFIRFLNRAKPKHPDLPLFPDEK